MVTCTLSTEPLFGSRVPSTRFRVCTYIPNCVRGIYI